MKRAYSLLATLAAFLLASGALQAGNPKVVWKVLTPKVTGAPGEIVEVKIQATIASGWHMYTTKSYPDSIPAPQWTEISAGEKSIISLAGKLKGPKPKVKYDEGFELNTEYWEGSPTFTIPVRIAKKAKQGVAEAWVNFYFQTCNEGTCLPPGDEKLQFQIEVSDKASADTAATGTNNLGALQPVDSTPAAPAKTDTAAAPATASTTPAAPAPPDQKIARSSGGKKTAPLSDAERIEEAKKKGLSSFILLAVISGLGALATPCVFPMIPITVSFFTKRKQASRVRVVRDASLYALGIFLTFTALGLVTSILFGATSITEFANNPIVNITLATIFLVLSLNLFGMFEIQLPTGVLNRLNAKADESSPWGLILMGLVFSVTSFTCTVPFIGSLLAAASQGEWRWPLIGTSAFAATFAFPFFLLALFPSLLKSMPKSGGWLNSVKVVMGFIEVAAAIKFLQMADTIWGWDVFNNRELFLAVWIAVAVMITLYLIGHFRLPHDTPVEKVGALRVLFSVSFLAFGFWLLTGLFGGNLGFLEGMIPMPSESMAMASLRVPAQTAQASEPDTTRVALDGDGVTGGTETSGAETSGAKGHGDWLLDDYPAALAKARATGKSLFVDFTGYNCGNCRLMERNMFTRSDVADLMNRYILVRLYTDRGDSINKVNQQLQEKRFKTVALPYYAIISPNDSTVAEFGGMTTEAEKFKEFLQQGLGGTPIAMK